MNDLSGGAMIPTATALIALVALAGAPPTQADGSVAHDTEIKAFASTMAIAKTVASTCPGIVADDHFLEALRLRLHVVDADRPAFVAAARDTAEVLRQGLSEAPSRQAWCDAVYRLYGPDGTMVRGVMRR